MAISQPCFSPRTNAKRDFRFPVQTDQRRRWHQAQVQKLGRCSVSSALPRIAFQTGGRCAQGISASSFWLACRLWIHSLRVFGARKTQRKRLSVKDIRLRKEFPKMPSLKCPARTFRPLEGYAGQSGRNGAPPEFLDSGLAPPSSLISLNGKPKISCRICVR